MTKIESRGHDPSSAVKGGSHRVTALGTIHKNSREEIRFTVETSKGCEIVNGRVWYCDDAGYYRPGKQGLAIRLELMGELLAALRKARKAGRP